ncbi:MAG: formate C-acetyltransferase/glycerol dehydratase family glycyl radical enzyme [Planctomycetaceae bacterium]|nr:formate C-acetyltransferase/glycerol dehydratase family glycyl radical enzyme [Planctomycetaceae bacterium]
MYMHETIASLESTPRIARLKDRMLAEPRYLSLEQALIITEVYQKHPDESAARKRALSLSEAMRRISIAIDPEELIVGNRTAGVRAGVVFPEAGISWIDKEIESLHSRPQDRFNVHPEDIATFREKIAPYWKGRSLEDTIRAEAGTLVDAIGKVVKINQKDHAQGHICPDVASWLEKGPHGLYLEAQAKMAEATAPEQVEMYACVMTVTEAACDFMQRYAALAREMAAKDNANRDNLTEIARICDKLSREGASTFREAVQSMWFLFTLLHLESNASSFSPGRADQYLYPYFKHDLESGALDLSAALEIIEALWLKFNQIVYLRNSHSASFFAGFPIGFNVALSGTDRDGRDATNELSFLFLKAQAHIGLPQPNLSARLHRDTPQELLDECSRVVGLGSGMPQMFNDEGVVPALTAQGISLEDARDYAIVGCVELTTQGNNLGWSDAAMFNLPKALELALNDGRCLMTGAQLGPRTGTLADFDTYEKLEAAFTAQIDFFFGEMIKACEKVEEIHQRLLPTALLSSVIRDCLHKGVDVTKGGSHYNYSGIQAIQPANIADSLAALKKLVYDEKKIDRTVLLEALRSNFSEFEELRLQLLNKAPKYGNDVEWVDSIAAQWIALFAGKFKGLKNYRGGPYHTGMYTVSAHVPMGANVGASPDGRMVGAPLADGGMSAVYGRDSKGPTALLNSVSRIESRLGSNGTLLNMKFLPQFFKTEEGIRKFSSLLRAFVALRINHVQFNVVNKEDLLAAQKSPDQYPNLTIRVAGYTAYFTELAKDLQDEIIARTTYEDA